MYTVNFSVKYGHGSIETFSHSNIFDLKWYLENIVSAFKINSLLIKKDGVIIIRENKNVEKFIHEFCA